MYLVASHCIASVSGRPLAGERCSDSDAIPHPALFALSSLGIPIPDCLGFLSAQLVR